MGTGIKQGHVRCSQFDRSFIEAEWQGMQSIMKGTDQWQVSVRRGDLLSLGGAYSFQRLSGSLLTGEALSEMRSAAGSRYEEIILCGLVVLREVLVLSGESYFI